MNIGEAFSPAVRSAVQAYTSYLRVLAETFGIIDTKLETIKKKHQAKTDAFSEQSERINYGKRMGTDGTGPTNEVTPTSLESIRKFLEDNRKLSFEMDKMELGGKEWDRFFDFYKRYETLTKIINKNKGSTSSKATEEALSIIKSGTVQKSSTQLPQKYSLAGVKFFDKQASDERLEKKNLDIEANKTINRAKEDMDKLLKEYSKKDTIGNVGTMPSTDVLATDVPATDVVVAGSRVKNLQVQITINNENIFSQAEAGIEEWAEKIKDNIARALDEAIGRSTLSRQ